MPKDPFNLKESPDKAAQSFLNKKTAPITVEKETIDVDRFDRFGTSMSIRPMSKVEEISRSSKE